MSRTRRTTLIATAIVTFLVVSFVVTRVLTAAGAEHDAVVELVKDQAAGDVPGVIGRVRGCAQDDACRAATTARVAALRRAGARVEVLRFDPPSRLALRSRTGVARIAWKAGGTRLPVVQCVRVRRDGDVLGGFDVSILAVSRPIGREAGCDGRRF